MSEFNHLPLPGPQTHNNSSVIRSFSQLCSLGFVVDVSLKAFYGHGFSVCLSSEAEYVEEQPSDVSEAYRTQRPVN